MRTAATAVVAAVGIVHRTTGHNVVHPEKLEYKAVAVRQQRLNYPQVVAAAVAAVVVAATVAVAVALQNLINFQPVLQPDAQH